jgi:hypothetical protein
LVCCLKDCGLQGLHENSVLLEGHGTLAAP